MADKEQPGTAEMRRVNVYISEEQWVNLRRTAGERTVNTRKQVSLSMLVRDALKSAGYGE